MTGLPSTDSVGVALKARSPLHSSLVSKLRCWRMEDAKFGKLCRKRIRSTSCPTSKIPVLMINGRYDFGIPLETCQQPFYRLLGTPAADKRQVLLDSGHGIPLTPWFKETLDWLDHYLGRVK